MTLFNCFRAVAQWLLHGKAEPSDAVFMPFDSAISSSPKKQSFGQSKV